MSDYGIASNESDTISIEEEITLLALKYSLVTEHTSFVAVDSNAVSGIACSDDGGGGGEIVEVENLSSFSNSNKALLHLIGTVTESTKLLTLKIENLARFRIEDLSIQISDLNGHTFTYNSLSQRNGEEEISIPLNNDFRPF